VSWEEVEAANAEIVLILPCGYPIEKTLADLTDPATSGSLRRLPAVATGQCFVLDGNAYFNRPGPRLADSAEILAAVCHPTRYAEYRERYKDCFRLWTGKSVSP